MHAGVPASYLRSHAAEVDEDQVGDGVLLLIDYFEN